MVGRDVGTPIERGTRAPGDERLVSPISPPSTPAASSACARSASRCGPVRSSPSWASTATARPSCADRGRHGPADARRCLRRRRRRDRRRRRRATRRRARPRSRRSRDHGPRRRDDDRGEPGPARLRASAAPSRALARHGRDRDAGARAHRRVRDPRARPATAARTLSGGNQQKIVLARELGGGPTVLVAEQPTRGLDPGATRFVIDQVLALREAGGAVLYISTELEEVLVADRIGVLYRGRLVGLVRREDVDLVAARPDDGGRARRGARRRGALRGPRAVTARALRPAGRSPARGALRHGGDPRVPDPRRRQEPAARLRGTRPRGVRLLGPHRRGAEQGHAVRARRRRRGALLPREGDQHRGRGTDCARRPGRHVADVDGAPDAGRPARGARAGGRSGGRCWMGGAGRDRSGCAAASTRYW